MVLSTLEVTLLGYFSSNTRHACNSHMQVGFRGVGFGLGAGFLVLGTLS